AVGDGAVVVLRGRESRPHGEGRQVDRGMGEQGTRDADGRPRLSPATGGPCAVKVACPVRGGADGKGLVTGPRRPPTLLFRRGVLYEAYSKGSWSSITTSLPPTPSTTTRFRDEHRGWKASSSS